MFSFALLSAYCIYSMHESVRVCVCVLGLGLHVCTVVSMEPRCKVT